jgi:hypothetical protein
LRGDAGFKKDNQVPGQRLQMSGKRVCQGRRPPLFRQGGNRPERSNVEGDRRPTIGDRFCLELASLYLKIVRQLGGGGGKASDATIGVLKDNELKFPAAL